LRRKKRERHHASRRQIAIRKNQSGAQ
jgi:hypothetical protein